MSCYSRNEIKFANKFGNQLTLSLFVLWIFTDYSDTSFSLDDFAFFTNRFYRRSNLHLCSSFHLSHQEIPSILRKLFKFTSCIWAYWQNIFQKRHLALYHRFYGIARGDFLFLQTFYKTLLLILILLPKSQTNKFFIYSKTMCQKSSFIISSTFYTCYIYFSVLLLMLPLDGQTQMLYFLRTLIRQNLW